MASRNVPIIMVNHNNRLFAQLIVSSLLDGISTLVGNLIANPIYMYVLNVYDLDWLGFMAYQPLWVI